MSPSTTPWRRIAGSRLLCPAPVASFVGHDDAPAALRALLTQGNVATGPLATRPRLITLAGVGGCGKTSLAIRAAADQAAAFADGVWLVELVDLTGPALIAQALADLALRRQFLGELAYSRADLALAERLFSEALAITARTGVVATRGAHLLVLGKVALRRGELEAADRFLREALALVEALFTAGRRFRLGGPLAAHRRRLQGAAVEDDGNQPRLAAFDRAMTRWYHLPQPTGRGGAEPRPDSTDLGPLGSLLDGRAPWYGAAPMSRHRPKIP